MGNQYTRSPISGSNIDFANHSFYRGRIVLVSGGSGLIGRQLCRLLLEMEATVRVLVHETPLQADLQNIEVMKGDLNDPADCLRACHGADFVFHLAAITRGVWSNVQNPGSMLSRNITLNTNMIDAAASSGVKRYLFTSSVCVYGDMPIFIEEKVWDVPPEKSNFGYAWAKRVGELQAQAYAEEYGMKIAIVRPSNAYGVGDNFDKQTSHVIPSLLRKALEHEDPLRIWGDGESTRDFVYSRDVARGMLLALERHPFADAINLATGRSVSINELAQIILRLTRYAPSRIVHESEMPKGQRHRVVSTAKASSLLGFSTLTSLEEGLLEVVKWCRTSGIVGRPD